MNNKPEKKGKTLEELHHDINASLATSNDMLGHIKRDIHNLHSEITNIKTLQKIENRFWYGTHQQNLFEFKVYKLILESFKEVDDVLATLKDQLKQADDEFKYNIDRMQRGLKHKDII